MYENECLIFVIQLPINITWILTVKVAAIAPVIPKWLPSLNRKKNTTIDLRCKMRNKFYETIKSFRGFVVNCLFQSRREGGRGTPYNSLYGEAPPKMVTFFRFGFGSKDQRFKIEGPDPNRGSNQL